jgi:hypothetical protein
MEQPVQKSNGKSFELRARIDGHEVVFGNIELWWSDPEPPEQESPSFALITSADVPPDLPHVEIECPAPEATTFKDLRGDTFKIEPLAADGAGGWMSLDLGRDFKSSGLPGRAWVARRVELRFEEGEGESLEGALEAELERSAARGGLPAPAQPVKLTGTFCVLAPRW